MKSEDPSEEGSNNNEEMTQELHYECTLVQADGNWDLENNNNYGDATDLWKSPTYTEYSAATTPNTSWWDGSISNLTIFDISAAGETMTFSYQNVDCNGNGIPDDQDIASGTSEDCDGNLVPDECDPDGDGDGIIDACDNCPQTSNPGQANTDADLPWSPRA